MHSKTSIEPVTAVIWIRKRDTTQISLVEICPTARSGPYSAQFHAGIYFDFPLSIYIGSRSQLERYRVLDPKLVPDIIEGDIVLDQYGEARKLIGDLLTPLVETEHDKLARELGGVKRDQAWFWVRQLSADEMKRLYEALCRDLGRAPLPVHGFIQVGSADLDTKLQALVTEWWDECEETSRDSLVRLARKAYQLGCIEKEG
jgi:hypothetical protein